MKILLAIFLPPVAVLMCGKPVSALINLLLCFCFVIPGIIHAVYIVNQSDQDRRMKEMAAIVGSAAAVANQPRR